MKWTNEQFKRLIDLGDDIAMQNNFPGAFPGDFQRDFPLDFPDQISANREFQKREKDLAAKNAKNVQRILKESIRPEGVLLREKLATALISHGFTQVETPLLVSRALLERMGISEDHPLSRQIFWVDPNRAVRPMLAPNLYHLLVDLLRISPGKVSIFEIGICLRKESQGARHGEEFTMLNVVEMGLPLEERLGRIEEISKLILLAAGLEVDKCSIVSEESGVYGETLDVLSPSGLELASTAMGPHPLDAPWGIDVPWVGLGFGMERLTMALSAQRGKALNLSRTTRSLNYLGGFRLNIPKGKIK